MFEKKIRGAPSFTAWAAQQVLALVVPALWAAFTFDVAERLKERATYPLDSAIDVAWYISVWCVGFFLALLVHRIFPGSATAGRWIWAMPTLLFVLAFASVAVGHGPGYALSDFIDPGPSGEAWWLVVTVTYPTCSSILYSIGMVFASNRAGRGMTPDSPSAV